MMGAIFATPLRHDDELESFLSGPKKGDVSQIIWPIIFGFH